MGEPDRSGRTEAAHDVLAFAHQAMMTSSTVLLRRPGILDVPTCAGTRRATDDANVSTRPVPIGTSAHFSLSFLRKKKIRLISLHALLSSGIV